MKLTLTQKVHACLGHNSAAEMYHHTDTSDVLVQHKDKTCSSLRLFACEQFTKAIGWQMHFSILRLCMLCNLCLCECICS